MLTIFDNFDLFQQSWQFLIISDNFQQSQQFLKILTIFYNFDKFWQFWPFLTILTIFKTFDNLDNFYIFWQFWQFRQLLLPFWQLKRQSWRLVTLERHWLQFWQLRTWIHDNLCYLTINCDTGQHSQFLRCFVLRVVK